MKNDTSSTVLPFCSRWWLGSCGTSSWSWLLSVHPSLLSKSKLIEYCHNSARSRYYTKSIYCITSRIDVLSYDIHLVVSCFRSVFEGVTCCQQRNLLIPVGCQAPKNVLAVIDWCPHDHTSDWEAYWHALAAVTFRWLSLTRRFIRLFKKVSPNTTQLLHDQGNDYFYLFTETHFDLKTKFLNLKTKMLTIFSLNNWEIWTKKLPH